MIYEVKNEYAIFWIPNDIENKIIFKNKCVFKIYIFSKIKQHKIFYEIVAVCRRMLDYGFDCDFDCMLVLKFRQTALKVTRQNVLAVRRRVRREKEQ